MVGATAARATAVAVAIWVMRNKRDYLWSAATASLCSTDMSPRSKTLHVRAPQSLTTRVAQKRKPEVLTLPFAPRPRK